MLALMKERTCLSKFFIICEVKCYRSIIVVVVGVSLPGNMAAFFTTMAENQFTALNSVKGSAIQTNQVFQFSRIITPLLNQCWE